MKRVAVALVLLFLFAACVVPKPTVSPLSPQIKTPTPTAAPIPPSNLSNGSFEEPYSCPGPAFCVADGWHGWYVNPPTCDPDVPGCYISCPTNCLNPTTGRCQNDTGCYWAQPEFARSSGAWNRIISGASSQKIFGYGRQFEGGLYRRVVAQQGRLYRFSIYMQAWMCYNYDSCNGGFVSDMPTTMHLRIGIDPFGGIVVTSTNVVWSLEHDSFDAWMRYTVTARAQSGHVTLFTYARPDWGTGQHLRINNDVYIEDADLVPLNEIYLPLVVR